MKIIFLALLALVPQFSFAEPAIDSEFGSWTVFTEDEVKTCYITGEPKDSAGNFKRRSNVYIMVAAKGEVSVSSGFNYQAKSVAEMAFPDATRFELHTTPATPKIAWAKDSEDDKAIISRMQSLSSVKIRGYSDSDSYAEDNYNLSGFPEAYSRMMEICK